MSIITKTIDMKLKLNKKLITEKELSTVYNRVSTNYLSSFGNFFYSNLADAMKYLDIGPNQSVLDVGCGLGTFSSFFKDIPCNYKGVDISQEMIEYAKKNYQDKSTYFEKIDIKNFIQFANENSYDVIFLNFSLKYFSFHLIEKLKKLLNRTGKLVILTELYGNYEHLHKCFEAYKDKNYSSLAKLPLPLYYPDSLDEVEELINTFNFRQSIFLSFEKKIENDFDYLYNSGVIPELSLIFDNPEYHEKLFLESLNLNNFSLPVQKYIICIAKK